MPQQVGKFDFNGIPPASQTPQAQPAAQAPAQEPEGGLSRLISGFAQRVLPSTTPSDYIEGPLYAAQHPIDSLSLLFNAIKDAHVGQAEKAMQAFQEGRYSEGLGHGISAGIPVVGPAIAGVGEQAATGDLMGATGGFLGLLAPSAAKGVMPKVRAPAAVTNKAATALESGATDRMVSVMAPKTGANKVRLGNMAREVAPQLARDPELRAMSRESLAQGVSARLDEATTALDEAANARLSARTFPTAPILQALKEKRRALTAETVEASALPAPGGPPTTQTAMAVPGSKQPPATQKMSPGRGPFGEDVVPGPNAGRVAQIDQAIAEIEQLGPAARYEPLRRIREAYDGPARTIYSPAVTPDFLKAKGNASGAADVTGVLRESLARFDPDTAAANANFHLYKTADTVLKAAQETQQVRPNMFRKTMARVSGASVGGASGGGLGAAVGIVIADALDAVANSGLTTKVQTARLMTTLADALQGNRTSQVQSLLAKLKRLSQTSERSATTAGRYQPAAETR